MSSTTLQIPTARVFSPLLHPARYKGAHGGRGSGKSHFFAGLAVEQCLLQPGTRIACVREVQKSLKNSVKPGFRTKGSAWNPALLDGLDFCLAEMARRNMKAVLYLTNFWEW